MCCLDFVTALCVVWTSLLHFQIYSMIKDTLSGALPVSVTTEGFPPKASLGFRDSSARKVYEGQRWGGRTGNSHLGQDVKLQVVPTFPG